LTAQEKLSIIEDYVKEHVETCGVEIESDPDSLILLHGINELISIKYAVEGGDLGPEGYSVLHLPTMQLYYAMTLDAVKAYVTTFLLQCVVRNANDSQKGMQA